jgi:acyl carrier protein
MGEGGMNDDSIAEAVSGFIVSNYYVPDRTRIARDTSLVEQGIIDSTGILELIGFLEGRFGIDVHDREMTPENLDSISSIVRFVGVKIGGQVRALSGGA